MTSQARSFDFSERFLGERRRFMYVVAASAVVVALALTLAVVDFDLRRWAVSAPFLIVALVPGAIAVLALNRYISNRWRQMTLHVDPDGLRRESEAVRQTIAWDNITDVCVRQNPRGEPRVIEVFSTQARPITLFGFEPMAEVEKLIRAGILSTVHVEVR